MSGMNDSLKNLAYLLNKYLPQETYLSPFVENIDTIFRISTNLDERNSFRTMTFLTK